MSRVAASVDPIADEHALARSMIEVHGAARAAAVARDNARTAALAGQGRQAKSWLRIVGLIQQQADDGRPRSKEPPHHPWAIPGVGGSF
jgi:hypothetical protein